ncbi:MAG: DUF4071 domain-containing protein, partial [Cyclobacteriaceae bacterium]|nr:DUF4071 domain-containing protein [Cyclobacteriaceae bacterium]
MNPYCFVITSYGEKDDLVDLKSNRNAADSKPLKKINFNKIYTALIEPAIIRAGLEPILESGEKRMGNIHKTMYEKIVLSKYCVADLTNLNPNVYYELGMRYAVKPFSTIPIMASTHFPLPFDMNVNRLIAYQVDENYNLTNREADIESLAEALLYSKKMKGTDSPLYDLVDGIAFQNSVAHEKTDIFRDRVNYDEKIKEALKYARAISDADENKQKSLRIEAIDKVVKDNGPPENIETAVLIDMMLSYRNVEAFKEMQAFIEKLPRYVFETIMVQEQYAFVLNRNGGKADPVDEVMISKAEDALSNLEKKEKASSETYGIWGRIHKDKFERVYKTGSLGEAKFHLKDALTYYKKGFEFDARDAYPGVNYVTCLDLLGKSKKAMRLVPAVEFAAKSKMKRKKTDYWDKATLLELAVIENKYEAAEALVFEAKPYVNEAWMISTTTDNLEKIMRFRKERGENVSAIERIIDLLN